MFIFFTTQFYYEQKEQYRECCETDTLSYLHRIEMDCEKRIDWFPDTPPITPQTA